MYSPKVCVRVAGLYAKHLSARTVADRVGISPVTVLRLTRECGVRVRRVGRPSNPDRDPALRQKGWTA